MPRPAGAVAEQRGGGPDRQREGRDGAPAAGPAVQQAGEQRAGGGEQVADALRHAGEMRRDVRIGRAQHDHRERDGDQRALGQPEHHRPQPDVPSGANMQPISPTMQSATLSTLARLWPGPRVASAGRDQRGGGLRDHGDREHQAGIDGAQPAVAQDRRQPAEHDVGQRRLQPHEQRDLPGQPVRPQPAHHEAGMGLAAGRRAAPGTAQTSAASPAGSAQMANPPPQPPSC